MGLHISFDQYTTDAELLFKQELSYDGGSHPWEGCHTRRLGSFYENRVLEYWAESTLGAMENSVPMVVSPAHLYKLQRRLATAVDRGIYCDFPVYGCCQIDDQARKAMVNELLLFINELLSTHDHKSELLITVKFWF